MVMVKNNDGKILLVDHPYRGWEFPGGYVNRGETIKEAAIREVEEETGIHIIISKFLGIEQDVEKMTCIIILEGATVSGELVHSDEHKGVEYFSVDEALNKMEIQKYKERLKHCVMEENIPFVL
ncbi:NUDIX hydrolase [Heyndrickxia oleronia]|uniref:NUDIX hydrolase n=1 Tax=Heyndrickxia oleronia TaxID=38875 RepID=UPI003F8452A7